MQLEAAKKREKSTSKRHPHGILRPHYLSMQPIQVLQIICMFAMPFLHFFILKRFCSHLLLLGLTFIVMNRHFDSAIRTTNSLCPNYFSNYLKWPSSSATRFLWLSNFTRSGSALALASAFLCFVLVTSNLRFSITLRGAAASRAGTDSRKFPASFARSETHWTSNNICPTFAANGHVHLSN